MIKLFLAAFIQVGLVAANTFFISKTAWIAILLCSFLISLTWTWNVKKVVFGDLKHRVIYALGAAIGGVSGVFISKLLFQ